jgi:hypothetical protein
MNVAHLLFSIALHGPVAAEMAIMAKRVSPSVERVFVLYIRVLPPSGTT